MIRATSTLIFCLLISPLAFSDTELLRSTTTQPAATQPASRQTTAKISPHAQNALKEIDSAYSKIKTLALSGTISFEQDVAGRQRKFSTTFTDSVVLPNKFRHEAKDNMLAGSEVWSAEKPRPFSSSLRGAAVQSFSRDNREMWQIRLCEADGRAS